MPLILLYMKSRLPQKQTGDSSTSAFCSHKHIKIKFVFWPLYSNNLLNNHKELSVAPFLRKCGLLGTGVGNPDSFTWVILGSTHLECEETKSLPFKYRWQMNLILKKNKTNFFSEIKILQTSWQNYNFYSSCFRSKLIETWCQTYFYAILSQWPHQNRKVRLSFIQCLISTTCSFLP